MIKKVNILVYTALLFCGSSVLAATNEVSEQRRAQLTHIVKQDCGSCHGMTLKGGLGLPLLPEDLENKNLQFVTTTIMQGRPGTAMPPFKALFSEAEARWIAEQLKKGAFK